MTGSMITNRPSTRTRHTGSPSSENLERGNPLVNTCIRITPATPAASSRPGMIPAMNRSMTEICDTALKITNVTDGGTIGPIIEPATTSAAAYSVL